MLIQFHFLLLTYTENLKTLQRTFVCWHIFSIEGQHYTARLTLYVNIKTMRAHFRSPNDCFDQIHPLAMCLAFCALISDRSLFDIHPIIFGAQTSCQLSAQTKSCSHSREKHLCHMSQCVCVSELVRLRMSVCARIVSEIS